MVANVKKILINIKDNTIIFSYKTSNSTINNDLINTNIISNNELIFSDIYIKENTKILTSFINELSIQYHVSKVIISKMDLALLTLNLLSKSSNINEVYFKDEEPLSYAICEILINIKNIKNINCYTIQPFMLELLDKNNITCKTRYEILYLSNFMETNNLIQYSNIYYKTNIRITFPLSIEDKTDIESFLKINKYLKTIHIYKLNTTELTNLLQTLKTFNRHLKIVIHENINDEKTANYLKELNKNYKKYHIFLTLEYSKDYLDENIFKQTIINTLKTCGLIISSLVILVVTYIGISNYVALKQVNKIKDDLAKVVEIIDPTPIIEQKNEENKSKIENTPAEENEPENEFKTITNTNLAALLTILTLIIRLFKNKIMNTI